MTLANQLSHKGTTLLHHSPSAIRRYPPLFLLGASRSGTTLLRLMLNEHPLICIPRESHFILSLCNALPLHNSLTTEEHQQAIEILLASPRFKTWELDASSARKALERLMNPTLSELVECIFRLEADISKKAMWGDKTPEYTPFIHKLASFYPDARFIHIVRDGRDVSISLRNVGWRGLTEYQRARYWSRTVSIAEREGKRLGPDRYLRVMYKDLVLEPEKTLRAVATYLHIPYDHKMLAFHEHSTRNIAAFEKRARIHDKLSRPPRQSDVDRWRSEMGGLRRWLFESIASRTLRSFGMELPGGMWADIIRKAIACVYIPAALSICVSTMILRLFPHNLRTAFSSTSFFRIMRNILNKI